MNPKRRTSVVSHFFCPVRDSFRYDSVTHRCIGALFPFALAGWEQRSCRHRDIDSTILVHAGNGFFS